jgi:hypothetical protein
MYDNHHPVLDCGNSMSMFVADATTNTDAAFDDAFTDSVNVVDGTTGILIGVAVVLAALLYGLRALTTQMDEAIGQVLLDFESTMKQRHPSRWTKIVEELTDLKGDERDIKLLKVMEEMQEKDPEFMLLVNEQMPKR